MPFVAPPWSTRFPPATIGGSRSGNRRHPRRLQATLVNRLKKVEHCMAQRKRRKPPEQESDYDGAWKETLRQHFRESAGERGRESFSVFCLATC